MASELSNYDMTVGVSLRIATGVILIGDVNSTNHFLILAEIRSVRFQGSL